MLKNLFKAVYRKARYYHSALSTFMHVRRMETLRTEYLEARTRATCWALAAEQIERRMADEVIRHSKRESPAFNYKLR